MASWKKKNLFNWHQRKHCASSKKTEISDLKVSSEENPEKLFCLTKECEEEIKSLKLNISQMGIIIADFQGKQACARKELHELKKEIDRNVNERSFSINEKRNIDTRIICLEIQLALGQAEFEMAKIKKIHLETDLFRLESRIGEIKKMVSKLLKLLNRKM